jgi:RNA-binding protein
VSAAPTPAKAKRPSTLTTKQRQKLRALAHALDPVVKIGKAGVTDGTRAAVDAALDTHELVKVRVLDTADADTKATATALADALGAHAVSVVGRVVTLYRRHPDEPRVRV